MGETRAALPRPASGRRGGNHRGGDAAPGPGGAVGHVGYPLKRAQHALRLAMDGALAPLDLTTPQYVVLSVLGQAEDAGEVALSGAELARRCFVTPQTMTGLVGGLEARDLVRRRPHPMHGRVLDVGMTSAGRDTLRRAHGVARVVERRMLAGRTAAEQRQFAAWLLDCSDALTPALDAKATPGR